MAPRHVRMKCCDSARPLAYSVISLGWGTRWAKHRVAEGLCVQGRYFKGQEWEVRMQGAWGCGDRQAHTLCVFTLTGGLDYILHEKGSQWRFEIREQSWYLHGSSLQRIGSVSVWVSIIKFHERIESKRIIPEGKGGGGINWEFRIDIYARPYLNR